MCFVSGLAHAQISGTTSEWRGLNITVPSYTPAELAKINATKISAETGEPKVSSEIVKLAIEQKDGTLKIIQAIKITIVRSVFITGPHITSFYLSLDGKEIKEGILVEKL